ncbi:MAG: c-type cytochrome biogenesis protein CcmI [Ideonella sp.]
MTDSIDDLRHKLQNLQDRHDRGELDAKALAEARAPLERELVALVVAGPGPAAAAVPAGAVPAHTAAAAPLNAGAARPSRSMTFSVLTGIVLLAVVGYTFTGSPRVAWNPPAASSAAADPTAPEGTAAPTQAQVREMVERLAERLKEKPDDLVGQTMLARSYAVMGRSDEAIAAFRKALALAGNDAGLMADLADALAAKNNGDLTGEPTTLVQRALAAEPGNLKALALSGSAAFDRHDYATAVRQWEQVERALPRDSGFLQQVQASIAQARQLGGLAPVADGNPAVASAKGPATPAASSISGTLTLAAALQSQVAADDTVFIVARAANGPRMPLAVLRKQVKDLPLTFALDDSMAMAPTAKISDHADVIVIARVSKSGNALPQPGDIGGQSAPVKPGATGIAVELNQVVKDAPAR